MRFKLNAVFVILLFVVSSCKYNVDYIDIYAFREDEKDNRFEVISEVLESEGIDAYGTPELTYIDYILGYDSYYKCLDNIIEGSDFSTHLYKSVIILYYSYSWEIYEKCPEKYNQKVKKYIVNSIPYKLSYGEDEFREYLENTFLESGVYLFPFFSRDSPIEQISNNLYRSMKWKPTVLVWNFLPLKKRDFIELNNEEQINLLSKNLNYLLIDKQINDQNFNKKPYELAKIINQFKEWLNYHRQGIIDSKTFVKLPEEAPFPDVYNLFIKKFAE